jgi:subtilase family serine protease
MMTKRRRRRHLSVLLALTLSAAALVATFAVAAPGVSAATAARHQPFEAQADDVGPTAAGETLTASLVLKVQHPEALEAYVAATQDPDSPLFHRFLSVGEFVARFAPRDSDLATIKRYLDRFGIDVTDVYADHLLIKVRGTADAFDKAFSVEVHDFVKRGKRYHRPRHAPRIPLLLRELLVAVIGPSSEPHFRPMHTRAGAELPFQRQSPVLPAAGAIATGVPGDYTVGDVANLYHINPLYQANIDGTGQTIGIATLAAFHPEDAFIYWNLIGLTVDPGRLTQVHLDGGAELGADAGSGETSLDVEQSGGLAPGARLIVYDAPNNDPGFMDLFYKAASDNLVDSLSVSWGSSELAYVPELNEGTDFTPELMGYHQAFLEAAAQGISVFAASGDNGAYDANQGFNDPFSNVLSVDVPGSDPAITSAGGTTTPVTFRLNNAPPDIPDLVVRNERVWGWDYVQNYLVKYVGPQFQNVLFPSGGGGGVSFIWPRPAYQAGVDGIRRTEPGQSVIVDDGTGSGPVDLFDVPAHFRGRNVPDVSLNADPLSGYLIYSTEDGGLIDGYGGTSFVAPQLNGVSALLSQLTHGRIGLWNPMLYRFSSTYRSRRSSPLVDIVRGDNWFYRGTPGYEPAAGLGVLDVTNLATALVREAASEN